MLGYPKIGCVSFKQKGYQDGGPQRKCQRRCQRLEDKLVDLWGPWGDKYQKDRYLPHGLARQKTQPKLTAYGELRVKRTATKDFLLSTLSLVCGRLKCVVGPF